jgi:cell division protein FtsA
MTLVAIDIGSHKVCTLIGEAVDGGVRVLGVGHAPSEGIRGGEIVHVGDAAGAIAASVERAERSCNVSVHRARVGVSGMHLAGFASRGLVPCGRRPRTITRADVDRVLDTAGTVPLDADREVLHVLAQYFTIDGGAPVESPVDMEACRLEASVYIVTASATALANVRRCLELAEVTPVGISSSTVAAAEAVLCADERRLGAFVLDLGASTSCLACYADGALVHLRPLPVGGHNMTTDLGLMLQTPLSEAEHIKITHGHVLPELDGEDREIEVATFGDGARRRTTRLHVSEKLATRADEIAQLVWDEFDKADLYDRFPAGAVLAGGGTEMDGMQTRLSARWGMPARVGEPKGVVGLSDAVKGPGHSAAVGLLLWDARGVGDAVAVPAVRSDTRGWDKVVDWARRAFLPNRSEQTWEGGVG